MTTSKCFDVGDIYFKDCWAPWTAILTDLGFSDVRMRAWLPEIPSSTTHAYLEVVACPPKEGRPLVLSIKLADMGFSRDKIELFLKSEAMAHLRNPKNFKEGGYGLSSDGID